MNIKQEIFSRVILIMIFLLLSVVVIGGFIFG